MAQQAQERGSKPAPDAAREAPPPPAEKGPKSKDGTLTEKEGRATGAPPLQTVPASILAGPNLFWAQYLGTAPRHSSGMLEELLEYLERARNNSWGKCPRLHHIWSPYKHSPPCSHQPT